MSKQNSGVVSDNAESFSTCDTQRIQMDKLLKEGRYPYHVQDLPEFLQEIIVRLLQVKDVNGFYKNTVFVKGSFVKYAIDLEKKRISGNHASVEKILEESRRPGDLDLVVLSQDIRLKGKKELDYLVRSSFGLDDKQFVKINKKSSPTGENNFYINVQDVKRRLDISIYDSNAMPPRNYAWITNRSPKIKFRNDDATSTIIVDPAFSSYLASCLNLSAIGQVDAKSSFYNYLRSGLDWQLRNSTSFVSPYSNSLENSVLSQFPSFEKWYSGSELIINPEARQLILHLCFDVLIGAIKMDEVEESLPIISLPIKNGFLDMGEGFGMNPVRMLLGELIPNFYIFEDSAYLRGQVFSTINHFAKLHNLKGDLAIGFLDNIDCVLDFDLKQYGVVGQENIAELDVYRVFLKNITAKAKEEFLNRKIFDSKIRSSLIKEATNKVQRVKNEVGESLNNIVESVVFNDLKEQEKIESEKKLRKQEQKQKQNSKKKKKQRQSKRNKLEENFQKLLSHCEEFDLVEIKKYDRSIFTKLVEMPTHDDLVLNVNLISYLILSPCEEDQIDKRINIIKFLSKNGASLDFINNYVSGPEITNVSSCLHCAVESEDLKLVEFILDNIDESLMNFVNSEGLSAFTLIGKKIVDIAHKGTNEKSLQNLAYILGAFLDRGFNPNDLDKKNINLIVNISSIKSVANDESMSLLLDKILRFYNFDSEHLKSSLLIACSFGNVCFVNKVLDEHPQLLNIPNEAGYTPFHSACFQYNFEIASLIIDKGFRTNNLSEKAVKDFNLMFNEAILSSDDEFPDKYRYLVNFIAQGASSNIYSNQNIANYLKDQTHYYEFLVESNKYLIALCKNDRSLSGDELVISSKRVLDVAKEAANVHILDKISRVLQSAFDNENLSMVEFLLRRNKESERTNDIYHVREEEGNFNSGNAWHLLFKIIIDRKDEYEKYRGQYRSIIGLLDYDSEASKILLEQKDSNQNTPFELFTQSSYHIVGDLNKLLMNDVGFYVDNAEGRVEEIPSEVIRSQFFNNCMSLDHEKLTDLENALEKYPALIRFKFGNEYSNPLLIVLSQLHYETDLVNNALDIFINNGVDLSQADYKKNTALQLACWLGDMRIINKIISHDNSTINRRGYEGITALHVACKFIRKTKDANIAHLLLENGADAKIVNNKGVSPLSLVCLQDFTFDKDETDLLKVLLHESDLKSADELGNTALINACAKERGEVIKAILDHAKSIGEDYLKELVNTKSKKGISALLTSCARCDIESVKMLLSYGADISVVDDHNNSALIYLLSDFKSGSEKQKDYLQIAKILLDHGANPELISSSSTSTVFMEACKKGAILVAKELKERSGDSDKLSLAVKMHNKKMQEYFYENFYEEEMKKWTESISRFKELLKSRDLEVIDCAQFLFFCNRGRISELVRLIDAKPHILEFKIVTDNGTWDLFPILLRVIDKDNCLVILGLVERKLSEISLNLGSWKMRSGINLIGELLVSADSLTIKKVLENYPELAFDKSTLSQYSEVLLLNKDNLNILNYFVEEGYELYLHINDQICVFLIELLRIGEENILNLEEIVKIVIEQEGMNDYILDAFTRSLATNNNQVARIIFEQKNDILAQELLKDLNYKDTLTHFVINCCASGDYSLFTSSLSLCKESYSILNDKFILNAALSINTYRGRHDLHLEEESRLLIIQKLLEINKNFLSEQSLEGMSLSYFAQYQGLLKISRYLRCEEMEEPVEFEYELLATLSMFGSLEELKIASKDLNLSEIIDPVTGKSLLHFACSEDNFDVVKYLVESGCDVNLQDKYGTTPFMSSCIAQSLASAKYLINLDGRVDVDIRDEDNMMAIYPLCEHNFTQTQLRQDRLFLIEKIINKSRLSGREILCDPNNFSPPISYGCFYGDKTLVEFLLKNGADVNFIDLEQNKSLLVNLWMPFDVNRTYKKISEERKEIANILMSNGLSPYDKNKDGITDLEFIDKYSVVFSKFCVEEYDKIQSENLIQSCNDRDQQLMESSFANGAKANKQILDSIKQIRNDPNKNEKDSLFLDAFKNSYRESLRPSTQTKKVESAKLSNTPNQSRHLNT